MRDRADKQAKDLLDIYALVFHNLDGADPYNLAARVPAPGRREAAKHVDAARQHRPQNAEGRDAVAQWLRAP